MHNDDLSACVEKKGSKFGFWHERFCVLRQDEMELCVYKSKNKKKLERVIKITPDLQCGMLNDRTPPRLIIKPANERKIQLALKSKEKVRKWAKSISLMTIQSKELSMNDFNVISVIGRGCYGKVTLCSHISSGKLYAIKSVRKSNLIDAHKSVTVVNERNFLKRNHNPFIINLHFTFQTNSRVYMGFEYAPGGDLLYNMSLNDGFTPEQIRFYSAETILAIDFIHKNKFIYRDIKPENILLDKDGHIKLADFGLVKNLQYSSSTTTFCGTTSYMAPEIIERKPYDIMADWWSIGILIYWLSFGVCPWEDENMNALFNKIVNSPLEFPSNADPDTVDIISHLLQKNPKNRAGYSFVVNHPFFKGMNFDDVYQKKIEPPFKPEVCNDSVLPKNFEKCFLNENINESTAIPVEADSDPFEGFEYSEK